MSRRFISLSLLGTLLLCNWVPTATGAIYYVPTISNCYMTKVGDSQWKGSFHITSAKSLDTVDSATNNFTIRIPKLSNNGSTILNQFVSPVPALDFTLPSGMVAQPPQTASILIGGPNGSNNIRSSGTISFTFSTKDNGAFPSALVRLDYGYVYTGGPASTSYGYYWLIPGVSNGSCPRYGNTTPPNTIPPIDEIDPPEPAFSLKSAVWELNTADVADVPDVAAAGNGFEASIKSLASNNLCVSYVTKGVKNKNYALSISNGATTQGGRNLFTLNGAAGSQLFYTLNLTSNDGVTANNFDFPAAAAKYITLSQTASGVAERSEMCWTPRINLFSNATTAAGMHTDTLNVIITPQA